MAEASLIPKNVPSARREIGGVSIFFKIALLFFIISFAIGGGLVLYRFMTANNLKKQRAALKELESRFPVEDIQKREEMANAIALSKKLLSTHRAQSGLFVILQDKTMPEMFFKNFSYADKDKTLSLAGEAPSYQSVAQQATIFEQLDIVEKAAFSNLSLTNKGTVNFNLAIVLKQ